MLNVLVTGANGQLGQSLQSLEDNAKGKGICLVYADRDTCDITDIDAIERYFQENDIDVVVNTAAYTAVDQAEDEPEAALLINSQGAENLAKVCTTYKCWLIHISTDYVFNGESTKPYSERDPVSPIGVYGSTKLDGENRVLQCNPEALIIRTSWVFSEFNRNFLKTMLVLAERSQELTIVSDQKGNPTYAPHIALAILKIITRKARGNTPISGIYHFSGSSSTNWADFARYIFAQKAQFTEGFIAPKVVNIKTDQYPTKACRPKCSILSNNKISALIGADDNDWKEGVNAALLALHIG